MARADAADDSMHSAMMAVVIEKDGLGPAVEFKCREVLHLKSDWPADPSWGMIVLNIAQRERIGGGSPITHRSLEASKGSERSGDVE